jgi:predicted RNA-binding protein with PUA-like domain
MSKKFDDYMANIARHLRDLPANVRENELIEMRSHLDQLRDDFTAQGQGREWRRSRRSISSATPAPWEFIYEMYGKDRISVGSKFWRR